jgi:hypothetical protein
MSAFRRVGLGQDRLDRRAVGQGYRLVAADDGPIQGQLEQGYLAAHRAEHGTPAHVRGGLLRNHARGGGEQ